MPGICCQHAGPHALRHAQHVTEQQFLADQCRQRDPQCQYVDLLHTGRIGDLVKCRPQHADADRQQNAADCQRCCILITLMTILMIGIGLLATVMRRKQHHEIGNQIRQRMHAIGNQGLRTREYPGDDLHCRQTDIDDHADHGAAAASLEPLLLHACGFLLHACHNNNPF